MAFPGEDSLPVAVDPRDSLTGHEVGEVPDHFANKESPLPQGVEGAEIFHHERLLVIFAEHERRVRVQSGDGVRSVLAIEHGLVVLCVPRHVLGYHLLPYHLQVTGVLIPAVVAVDADDVHVLCLNSRRMRIKPQGTSKRSRLEKNEQIKCNLPLTALSL